MAYLSGLKKQINKANQFMTEKISGVEGTKLDDDFYVMEKKSDLIVELVDDLQIKTKEYLQPNPTVRAKMAAVKGISKLSGQAKASTYPQPEGTLGEAMLTYGNKLQEYDREWVICVLWRMTMWDEIHLRVSLHNLSALCAKLWELSNGGKCVYFI